MKLVRMGFPIFVFLALGCLNAFGKALVWEEFPLEKYRERQEVQMKNAKALYYTVTQAKPLEIRVRGPRKLLALIRNGVVEGDEGVKEYRLNVLMDERNFDEYAFRAQPSTVARPADPSLGYGKLGKLRKFIVEIPDGLHELKLFPAEGMNHQMLFLRFYVSEWVHRDERRVSMSPEQYSEVVPVIYKEREHTYYRMSQERPILLSVVGPSELKVITRLEFHGRMKGKQSYQVQVHEDGALLQVCQYRSYKSDVASYKKVTNLTPGRSRSFFVAVPKGRHTYRFTPVALKGETVIAKMLIPEKDVSVVEE